MDMAIDINMHRGNSFLTVFCFTAIGYINAPVPIIKRLLLMLLPITFPKTISEAPFDSAWIETANSGALVPKATIVRPINILDTLKFCAVDDAPSTKISAPFIRKTKPIINNITCIIIVIT